MSQMFSVVQLGDEREIISLDSAADERADERKQLRAEVSDEMEEQEQTFRTACLHIMLDTDGRDGGQTAGDGCLSSGGQQGAGANPTPGLSSNNHPPSTRFVQRLRSCT
ncbi:unnamed protein product [Pleuronectes platessa]|uniref:Uncharacterized protein n=1 Tax=Pleuronectes platessa TaxID=8262 RepID=A0A9N7VDX6_PLEPL|nr:unnamed protein product [Pleuronectes platessa]